MEDRRPARKPFEGCRRWFSGMAKQHCQHPVAKVEPERAGQRWARRWRHCEL